MGAFFVPRITIVTRETRMKGLLKRWATKGMLGFNFKQARVAAAVQSGDMPPPQLLRMMMSMIC